MADGVVEGYWRSLVSHKDCCVHPKTWEAHCQALCSVKDKSRLAFRHEIKSPSGTTELPLMESFTGYSRLGQMLIGAVNTPLLSSQK